MRAKLGRIGLSGIVLVGSLVASRLVVGAGAPDTPRKPYQPDAQELRAAYARAESARERFSGKVFRESIQPHWFDQGKRFWYRNDGRAGTREFILVDATQGVRARAFDHARLAASLARASQSDVDADKLPFDSITWVDEARVVEFRYKGDTWHCTLASYECKKGKAEGSRSSEGSAASQEDRGRDEFRGGGGRFNRGGGTGAIGMFGPLPTPPAPVRSPDGKWAVEVRDYNVTLSPVRETEGGRPGRRRDEPPAEVLTHDGRPDRVYGDFAWSPDSKTLIAWRTTPARKGEVHLIESSPRDGGRARLHTRPYDLPGDPFPVHELWIYNLETRKGTSPEVPPIDFGPNFVKWKDGGQRFTFTKTDRGHQRFRLFEVDARTGQARTVIDESSKTFVNTYTDPFLRELDRSKEILFKSERDGWAHLYLIDATNGKVKNAVTHGEWVVRHVDRVDEEKRQIWFQGSGRTAGEDPYHIHHYRVNFDGTGLVELTEGDGDHTIAYSPDRTYLIDTYSRADLPPVHALRRTTDGSLVCALEKADSRPSNPRAGQCPRFSRPRDATARPTSGVLSFDRAGSTRRRPTR
ncbi:MAG: DPP IV N-terminal domain-containing protein [Isosphaeraceae bacterium]